MHSILFFFFLSERIIEALTVEFYGLIPFLGRLRVSSGEESQAKALLEASRPL